ncbi:RNA methyltransferase [Hyunsoonleella sp. SJ7]|uniref:RNA methyltransferase n=1 Tax=Hyunsoonleella aquatilis TaxID=2762758 RepID=A0A923KKK2_9FLAO|nr:TfoX/Sxy family protein [Hyunsoonleella aquatilis]MBC3758587.1 RNA methyltransferase [Hyunsoonleella aquatilis]
MAYDEFLADRIRRQLKEKHTGFSEFKMMGGLCFKVDNKMLCGIHIDKKYGDSLLMARIGLDAYEKELEKPECLPMDFTGRPMKGYIFVAPEGFDSEETLTYWLDLCLKFNPLAKASKSRKPKK